MTTLCLCDWVDVSADRQRDALPIVRVAPVSSERERVVVLTRVEAEPASSADGGAVVTQLSRVRTR